MSQKGGQNLRKDGGALLNPHERTVRENNESREQFEEKSELIKNAHALADTSTIQNGGAFGSGVPVSTSGGTGPFHVQLVELDPNNSVSLDSLDKIVVSSTADWLKKSLGNVEFDHYSASPDELDGHIANKTKDDGDIFVVAEGVLGHLAQDVSIVSAPTLHDVVGLSNRLCEATDCVSVTGQQQQPDAVHIDPEIVDESLSTVDPGSLTCTEINIIPQTTTDNLGVDMSTKDVEKNNCNCKSSPDKELFDCNNDDVDSDDMQLFHELRRSDKNNTLMTPQELENIPDECLELDESIESLKNNAEQGTVGLATSIADIVKKMWSSQSSTNTGTSESMSTDADSILENKDDPGNSKTDNVTSDNLSADKISVPMGSIKSTRTATIVTSCVSSLHVGAPVLPSGQSVMTTADRSSVVVVGSNSNTASVLIPPQSPTVSQTNNINMNDSPNLINSQQLPIALPNNCTLATIYISTDKGSNSTQIRVNSGSGQQFYQLNTSSLTGSLPLANILQTGAVPVLTNANNQQTETAQITSSDIQISPSTGDCVTGYLLLPVGHSDPNGILMSMPFTGVDSSDHDQDTLESSDDLPNEVDELGKKYWSCHENDCGKIFRKQSKFKIHQMRHTGVRPFKCDKEGCGWAFTTAYKLRRHEESHEGKKDYICNINGCGRKFTTVYNLNSHSRLHDRPCNEVCQEPGCGERFPTKRQLDLHMKNHSGAEKNYKCPVAGCDKVFFSSNCMGSHARVHQQEREDLTCKFEGCGKVFEKMCRLKQHMRSHTGEKPYICSYEGCGWAFTTASKLTRHLSKHTGERKWECPIDGCGKAFMRAEHLKGHMVTHSGAKPFLCPVEGCNARFTAKSSLYVHLKKHDHSGEKIIYFCPMEGCERKYSTKSCLRNHITKHYATSVSVADQAHFDLVPLLAGDDLPEGSLDNFTTGQSDHGTTPVSAVNINTAIPASLLGTSDPVLISPSDYITTDHQVMTAATFPGDNLAPQLGPNIVTQYIVTSDLQSPGAFSGASLGVVSPAAMTLPTNPMCTNCASPVLTCTCATNSDGPSIVPCGGKHRSKISIGKNLGAGARVLQENSSGSARTDYRGNHLLSDRAKKRRLLLKNKLNTDLPTLQVSKPMVVSHVIGGLVSLPEDVMSASTPAFRPTDLLTSQGITYRDPDTGTTYVQTQLLQDDPPNPELYPDDSTLGSELVTLHNAASSDVSSTQFTGTTINLQDLE